VTNAEKVNAGMLPRYRVYVWNERAGRAGDGDTVSAAFDEAVREYRILFHQAKESTIDRLSSVMIDRMEAV
jgi:hypothetical protein